MKQLLLVVGCVLILYSCKNDKEKETTVVEATVIEPKLDSSLFKFGLNLANYHVVSDSVRKNDFLSTILENHGVKYLVVDQIAREWKDTFDIRKIRPNRPYHVLYEKNNLDSAVYFIYEKSKESYVFFGVQNHVYACNGKHPVEVKIREASGIINSSLSVTMQEENLSVALAMEMADIYAWTIDFYRLQKGDYFKVIFEEKYIDGKMVGVGDIIAADFNHGGEDFYSFWYTNDSIPNFFDEKGQSLKKAFLKSPLKFSRISSPYSKRRFHPVLKRFKSHLGTDYAAPTGTPILAVGDGTVIKSEYKRNNGNYVKISHNSTYETQYLHMSKRMVKVGDVVRQGETIGLVGSTGLATGPHVCFRFWKNGKQEDHRKEKFPPSTPIDSLQMEGYLEMINALKIKIEGIKLKEEKIEPLLTQNP